MADATANETQRLRIGTHAVASRKGAWRLRALPGKIGRRLRRWYHRWFQNSNYVFRHGGPYKPAIHPACVFLRYETFEEVPENVRQAILLHQGERALAMDRQEMSDGAIMWVAMSGASLAGVQLVSFGNRFQRWYVPLNAHDIVISRVRTFEAYRGGGICPTMMRHIMHATVGGCGSAYVVCNAWNHPSVRSIEKAGFVRVATMKPITRLEAVGSDWNVLVTM